MKTLSLCFAAVVAIGCTNKDVLAQQQTNGTAAASGSGASSGASSGQGATSVGASSTGSGGHSSAASSSSGAVTTSSGGSSGSAIGSTDGGFNCPTGFVYVSGNCIAGANCSGLPNDEPCTADGGLGTCTNGLCNTLDLQTDPNNCGQTGIVCANGETCVSGVCTDTAAKCDCPADRVCINGTCYFDATCTGAPAMATCFTSAQAEESGFCCGGACQDATDFSLDANNCGTCGNVCAADAVCVNSACVSTNCAANAAAETPCFLPDGGIENQAGQNAACCGGACRDLTQDPNNCGYCNAQCAQGESCVNGSCTNACVTSADCSAGFACYLGACYQTSCPATGTGALCAVVVSATLTEQGACCNGTCTSLNSDPANCGSCGASCGGGNCVYGGCSGETAPSCSGTAPEACFLDGLPGACCSGTCSLVSDDENCGACGHACPTGSTCFNGQCTASGQFQTCHGNSDCPSGHGCLEGVCVATSCTGANDDQQCLVGDGGPGVCCGGTCSDLITDSNNCQVCGRICPVGTSCQGALESDGPLANCNLPNSISSGNCSTGQVQCPTGTVCSNDLTSCAKQTLSCAGQADGTTCGFGGSAAGPIFGQCCGGSCVNTAADPANCGACGQQCLSGVCAELVAGLACVPAGTGICSQTCAPGTECLGVSCVNVTCFAQLGGVCPAQDGNLGICGPTDGGTGFGCYDVLNDPANCGTVGVACPAGQTCSQGLCSGTLAPCNSAGKLNGYCNLDAGLGFVCCQGLGCVDTDNDPSNCGGCGFACLPGQTCTAGNCG